MTRAWRAGALAIAVVAAACGLKRDPVAPERVRPLPPAKVSAKATPDGVALAWRRPTTYTGGGRMRDLGGFDVERASTATGPFVRVGTVTLTDQQRFRQERAISWVDGSATAGHTYYYRVIAFTTDGSRSDPSPVSEIHATRPARTPPADGDAAHD